MNNETQICPTCKQQIDPGAGYRLLSIGEIRTAGDEFYDRGGWRSIRNVWLSRALRTNSSPTRRKIAVPAVPPAPYPGEGYRFLSLGEIFLAGDEFFSIMGVWYPILSSAGEHMRTDSRPTRRKIELPVLTVKVYPGVGYRLLEIGEVIRKSDEAFAEGNWQSFEDEGKIFDGKLFFFPRRRKIKVPPDPGLGYRLLDDGETILTSDQYNSDGGWTTTSFAGGQAYAGIYRRKIEVPPATWIVTDEPVGASATYPAWFGGSMETRNVVEPGEGYRLLAPNEILEVGDEFFAEVAKAWEKFYPHTAGQPLCPGATARRRIPPARPDPGAGYRLLAVGEVRQVGDEYFTRGKWDGPTADAGRPVWDISFTYRRKISPKQYRIVSAGEIIQTTDEIWADSKGWFTAKHLVGFVVSENVLPIRREINSYIGGPA